MSIHRALKLLRIMALMESASARATADVARVVPGDVVVVHCLE
jgi:hypothetical protein